MRYYQLSYTSQLRGSWKLKYAKLNCLEAVHLAPKKTARRRQRSRGATEPRCVEFGHTEWAHGIALSRTRHVTETGTETGTSWKASPCSNRSCTSGSQDISGFSGGFSGGFPQGFPPNSHRFSVPFTQGTREAAERWRSRHPWTSAVNHHWLVVEPYPSETYEFVNLVDYSQHM